MGSCTGSWCHQTAICERAKAGSISGQNERPGKIPGRACLRNVFEETCGEPLETTRNRWRYPLANYQIAMGNG